MVEVKYFGIKMNDNHIGMDDLGKMISKLDNYTPRKIPNHFDGPNGSVVKVTGHKLQTDIEIYVSELEMALGVKYDLNVGLEGITLE